MRVKSTLSVLVGLIAAAAVLLPASAVADTAGTDCAVVAAAAPAPNQPSPILGSQCFATHAQADQYAAQTAGMAQLEGLTFAGATPDASIHLAVSWSGTSGGGKRIDWYGTSGACSSSVSYAFENFSGWVNNGLKSDSQDLLSDADCYIGQFYDGAKLDGAEWSCVGNPGPGTNSCYPAMPSGDQDRASSVRMIR